MYMLATMPRIIHNEMQGIKDKQAFDEFIRYHFGQTFHDMVRDVMPLSDAVVSDLVDGGTLPHLFLDLNFRKEYEDENGAVFVLKRPDLETIASAMAREISKSYAGDIMRAPEALHETVALWRDNARGVLGFDENVPESDGISKLHRELFKLVSFIARYPSIKGEYLILYLNKNI